MPLVAYAVCKYVDYEFVSEGFCKALAKECTCFDGHGWCGMAPFKRTANTCQCFDFVAAAIFA
jgi:hypothetical protein